jgi:NAD(P)-dependent dehydrogenase (short-subunit alcohol dehydrogenase family)
MGVLTDKVILVTGVARGCGRVLAEAFSAKGAKLVGCDRDADGGRATAATVQSAGGQMIFVEAMSPTTRLSGISSPQRCRPTVASTAR